MSLFILPENQNLIWNTINKVPSFQKMGENMADDREAWFKNIMQDIYDKNRTKSLSMQELRQLNKETISSMISQLKMSKLNESVSTTPISDTTQGFSLDEDKTASRNYILGQKQNVLNNEFTNRQQEFESMMQREPVKDIDFREKNDDDTPIENMDELLQRQMREREYDVELSSSTTTNDLKKENTKTAPKNVKWATEIESGPSNQYVEFDIFQEFVRNTRNEIQQMRTEISTLRAEKLRNTSNEPQLKSTSGTSVMNTMLSRLRKTPSAATSTSIGDLEDISQSLTI
jgi:hypothetical protein